MKLKREKNVDQNPARIWTTPPYTVIAGFLSDIFPSILKQKEKMDISVFSSSFNMDGNPSDRNPAITV